jgi:hypothetical protein
MGVNIFPVATSLVGPANSDIATAVASAVPTISAINTSVSTYASPYGGTITSLGTQSCTGSATVTFSSLGSYKNLRLFGFNIVTSGSGCYVRINNDSGTNYYSITALNAPSAGYASGSSTGATNQWTSFADGNPAGFYIEFDQTASGGYKMGKFWCGYNSTYSYGRLGTLMWNSTAAITSISLIANGGNFTNGQAWMVGAS